jgi:hypothetical protein
MTRIIEEVYDTRCQAGRRHWLVRFTGTDRTVSIREERAVKLTNAHTVYTPDYISANLKLPRKYGQQQVRQVIWRGFRHLGFDLVRSECLAHISTAARDAINQEYIKSNCL